MNGKVSIHTYILVFFKFLFIAFREKEEGGERKRERNLFHLLCIRWLILHALTGD